MRRELFIPNRRLFLRHATLCTAALGGASLSGGLFGGKRLLAHELMLTPPQTEGPFYPDRLPLDTDNDLIIVNETLDEAIGTITHLTGTVKTTAGSPIRNALVEIWQVDGKGSYLHSRGAGEAGRDGNFQGFGRFLTAADGRYYFRTIKPVPYPGRTPHIHVKVKVPGQSSFTTQCYIKGEPRNARDGIFRRLGDAKRQAALLVDFQPVAGTEQIQGRFDIVLGVTPRDKKA